MALPAGFSATWKVKIRDRERLEPPHVTAIHGTAGWRFNLRTLEWMDAEPDPRVVPHSVLEAILNNMHEIVAAWDRMYPSNPVFPSEEDDE